MPNTCYLFHLAQVRLFHYFNCLLQLQILSGRRWLRRCNRGRLGLICIVVIVVAVRQNRLRFCRPVNLDGRAYRLFHERLSGARCVLARRDQQGASVRQREELLFGTGTEGPLANQLTSLLIAHRCGDETFLAFARRHEPNAIKAMVDAVDPDAAA